ncbi:hypothetical protein [Pseudooceanicola algae]|uniref:Uncharacterized protein n=1 Tax=Pseudooceanicola algae TaxID=1537215 RepID=A0A418SIN6_9RHOB|nr:hypothetical protein [Pseudooceanicola algae]QPM91179.1 hypothetical protein PSAL_024280 [Pseudooceanicola algae]
MTVSFFRSALTFCATLALAAPALAQGHGLTPERGTEGLVAVPFAVQNIGVVPLTCGVKLAHWYSFDIGTVAFGATLSSGFWSDPETGAVLLLNPVEDQMPVERIWCGVAGRSWDTRFEMPLKRAVGAQEVPMEYSCTTSPEDALPEAVEKTVCTAF